MKDEKKNLDHPGRDMEIEMDRDLEEEPDAAFLTEILEKENITAPESLSEENMLALLLGSKAGAAAGGKEEEPREDMPSGSASSGKKRSWSRRRKGAAFLAAACCIMLTVIGISGKDFLFPSYQDQSGEETAAAAGSESIDIAYEEGGNIEIRTFQSENEIRELMETLLSYEEDIVYETAEETDGAEAAALDTGTGSGSAAAKSDTAAAGPAAADPAAESHSDTYKQVEGVDEADIVKTDGKNIYHVVRGERIVISSAADGKTQVISRITPDKNCLSCRINDIYLTGNKLVVTGTRLYESEAKEDGEAADAEKYPDEDVICYSIPGYYYGEQRSFAAVYDITDASSPEEISLYEQSGEPVSSRMIGNYLYLVTNDFPTKDRILPCAGFGKDGKVRYEELPASSVAAFPEPNQASYVVIGSVDITGEGTGSTVTRAVLGASHEIYCNQEHLFVTQTVYDYGNYKGLMYGWSEKTELVRASLKEGQVVFEKASAVRGYINDQFSMDEKDGMLRVATTSSANGTDVNNLFVLDPNMEILGSITGFAKDEHIKAVRFIGEKAYVITYVQTDPLFIIDLSDPKSPKIEGEVKISGFSTLLHPAGDGLLLGLGYSTESNAWGEATKGLKIALFGIQDPSRPKVLQSEEFPGIESAVQYDHRALVYNAEEDYYALPFIQFWEEGGSYANGGVLCFRIENGKIRILERFSSMTEIERAVFIGDWIYGLGYDEAIESWRMTTSG